MENTCVCCGEIIPEGRMVCCKCENILDQDKHLCVVYARHNGRKYYMELMEKWRKLIGLKN